MILKFSTLLILANCFVSAQTNKALQFKSIHDYVGNSNSLRTVYALNVSDSTNIHFKIVDTVNSISDQISAMMILYPDYISHKYNKTIKEWDSDSSVLSSVDSMALLIKPYYSKDLRNLSSPTSHVNCKVIEYEPSYIGVLITGPLKESLNNYRSIDPEFLLYMLFHVNSNGVIKLVGEHSVYTGKVR